jgi:hypothetical protein
MWGEDMKANHLFRLIAMAAFAATIPVQSLSGQCTRNCGFGVSVSPFLLTFAPQPVGTKSTAQSVRITNLGNEQYTVTESIVGPFVKTHGCSVLPAHWTCFIAVEFAPKVKGAVTGKLKIVVDGDHTVILKGKGI